MSDQEPVTRRERQGVGLAVLLLALLTSLPYAYGYLSAPDDRRFLGVHSINTADMWVYVGAMEQARAGHLLLRNLSATEPHPPFAVRPVYTLGGWLSALLHVPCDVGYHVLRVVAGALLVLALHGLARRVLDRARDRLVFLAVACAASGLGWTEAGAPIDTARSSVDRWMPEAVTFLAAYESPHFTTSLVCLVAVVTLVLDAAAGRARPWSPVAAGALTLLLALEHPYDLLPLSVVLVLWPLARRMLGLPLERPLVLTTAGAFGGMALGAAWFLGCTLLVPIVSAWEKHNVLLSPSPLAFLWGAGLLLPLGAAGALALRRCRPDVAALLVAWAVVPLLMVYLPLRFQRRMLEGAQLPLALLGTIGLLGLLDRPTLARGARAALALGAVLLLPLTNALVVAQDVRLFSRHQPPYHAPRALLDALAFVRARASDEEVVLARPDVAYLVGGTGLRTYVGHRLFTVDYEEKVAAADAFLRAPGPAPFGARWVVVGTLVGPPPGPTWLAHDPGWERVFAQGDVAVYRAR